MEKLGRGIPAPGDIRLRLGNELGEMLNALPSPQNLRRQLVAQWIRSEERKDSETLVGTIMYETRYDRFYNYTKDRNQAFSISLLEENSWREDNPPYVFEVDKPAGTIQALKSAFGENAQLHRLPLRFLLRIQYRRKGYDTTYHSYVKNARETMEETDPSGAWIEHGRYELLEMN